MTDDTDTTDDGSDASPADAWTGDAERTTTAAAADAEADGGHGGEAAPEQLSDDGVTAAGGRDVREYLLKGSLVMLAVLGVVATLQFYVHAQTAIGRLVASDYRPLFLAVFNLVVLLAVGIGIAQVVRRLG